MTSQILLHFHAVTQQELIDFTDIFPAFLRPTFQAEKCSGIQEDVH